MGFSAAWLDLREPADHAARDQGLLRAAAAAAGPAPVIVDLGCGAGSTLRAFDPVLTGPAAWRLVDADPALLAVAAQSASAQVTLHQIDLRAVADLPLAGASLVTASALLDLCSAAWVSALAARLAAQRVPFYTALNYDGQMGWQPADAADAAVTAAFNAHQRGDKGFGPALGPDCATQAAAIFRAAGFVVQEADSPWHLGPAQADLHHALLAGIGMAAAETGLAAATDWALRRQDRVQAGHGRIGHRDFLALPAAAAAT